MAQDYGAAEPLIEAEKNFISKAEKVENLINKVPTYDDFKKKDTSWHDSMVGKANESFRKNAESKRKVGGAEKEKPVPKKTGKKSNNRKRVASKG